MSLNMEDGAVIRAVVETKQQRKDNLSKLIKDLAAVNPHIRNGNKVLRNGLTCDQAQWVEGGHPADGLSAWQEGRVKGWHLDSLDLRALPE